MSVLLVLELLEGWAALGGAMIPRAHARTIQAGLEIDLVILRYEGTWRGGD